jgi:hypothetical protein
MTGAAFDMRVGRSLPALVERLHVMAGVTKSGMRGVFDRTDQKNEDEPNAGEDDYSLYFLLVFLLFLHS